MKYTNKKQEVVNEIHKPARKKFRRRRVIMVGIDNLWQADLAEMGNYASENKGYKFILLVIDTFSKFGWAEPIKNKTGEEVSKAFEKILSKSRIPKNLQTDNGREFYNKCFQNLMKKHNINHYSTFSIIKAGQAERLVRTIKEKLYKKFSLYGSYKWYNILDGVMREYNMAKHRTIKMAPNKVTTTGIEKNLLNTVYNHIKITEKSKLKVGDIVRISKYRHIFEKSYTPGWTTELFRIRRVQNTSPITYLLEDFQSHPINGGFYKEELQKTKNENAYLVEKILKTNKNKIFVKWLGFSSKFNQWIFKKDLI